MKKVMYSIIAVIAVSLSASFVFAEEMKGSTKADEMGGKGMMMGKGMMGKGMMEDGMMDGGMMKMMMHMHGMMMRSPTMVASNDGGVIVLTGNKLYKYDKNLNLVKEAEVKTEGDGGMMGGMGGMMGGMGGMMKGKKKGGCPMMGGDDTSDDAAPVKADQPAQEKSEHESHH